MTRVTILDSEGARFLIKFFVIGIAISAYLRQLKAEGSRLSTDFADNEDLVWQEFVLGL